MNHKYTAVLLGAALLLTGCGKSPEPEFQEDELPYGATITIDTTRSVALQYDYRFLDSNELDVIAAYFTAIENADAQALADVQFPLYHDYQLNQVLGGQYTDEDIASGMQYGYEKSYGAPFEFALIDITERADLRNPAQATDDGNGLIELLDALTSNNGMPKFSETTAGFYELTVTRYLADAGSGAQSETETYITDEKLYTMEYQGKWYVIYT